MDKQAVEELTPEQEAAVCHTMGVTPAGQNPYASTRGPAKDRIGHYSEYEAHESWSQYSRDIKLDDLFSNREISLFQDREHYKARVEILENQIAEACKILQTNSLVVAVRAMALAYRELQQQKTEE
jgi:hypothetical protein